MTCTVPTRLHLAPLERRLVRTGLALAIPDGYEAQVRPRSGLALKHGVTLPMPRHDRLRLSWRADDPDDQPRHERWRLARGTRIASSCFQRVEVVELEGVRSCRRASGVGEGLGARAYESRLEPARMVDGRRVARGGAHPCA